MIPLAREINYKRYTYTQVLKGKRYCLYEQNGIANMRCFELFKIKVSREKKINGTIIEKKELFPSDLRMKKIITIKGIIIPIILEAMASELAIDKNKAFLQVSLFKKFIA